MTRHTVALLGLLLLGVFLFFHCLADRDLWSSHEARAAQNAQSILTDDAWGLPHLLDGKPELQKPPLYYWLVAAAAGVSGGAVDAWVVRLPAALAGLGGVGLVYFVLRRRGRPVAAFLAAGVLATALHYTLLARTGRIDMPLTLTVGVAVTGYYFRVTSRLALVAAYGAVAAGVLLKGPVGLVLPAAVIVLHLLVEGRLPALWRGRRWLHLAHDLGLWWGLPLVLALTVPWFLWVDRKTDGAFSQSFFLKHNLQRGLGGADDLAAHPWWFYAPRFLLDFLPWSPALVFLAWQSFRRGWWADDPEARFGLAWLAAVAGVLSLASFKRADYLLPAYPGAALFVGCAAERWLRHAASSARLRFALFPVSFGLVAVGWWFYVGHILPLQEPELESRRFAEAVRREAGGRMVLFFRTENHALAFHVGRPVATLLEWENLDVWAAGPDTISVVMPPDVARDWPRHLKAGYLEEVLHNTALAGGRHARPLVLLRTRTADAGTAPPAADRRSTRERAADGVQRPGPPERPPGEVDAAPRQAPAGL